MPKKGVITIDGPAGAGKSTISLLLAKKLGYLYLDTGAMYRAVALSAMRKGVDFSNGVALHEMCRDIDINFRSIDDNYRIYIGAEDISDEIRRPEIDMLSSKISAIKEVRDAMTGLQRRIGRRGGIVAEGRDMGTVVFPDADHKFFLTASPGIRAARRYKERLGRGEYISMEQVETELRKRDEQDKTRIIAPLRPAVDAIIIDTTALGIDGVAEEILERIGKTEKDKIGC
ncbi:MAG TPA: (d)CMP kinase [Desulfatiglandales bacterium]|nr:(d)CMP kinase [Desulfatiglandales bacterium]